MAGETPPPLVAPPTILSPSTQSVAPPSLRSPSPATAKLDPSLQQQIFREQPAAGEVLGDPQPHASDKVLRDPEPHASGEVGGKPKISGEIHGELPNKSRKKETVGGKRPVSDASESSRARKAAKIIDSEVTVGGQKSVPNTIGRSRPRKALGQEKLDDEKLKQKQLVKIKQESEACGEQRRQVAMDKTADKSKTSRRKKKSPIAGQIVSGSSMVNMIARRNANSSVRSPNLNSPAPGDDIPADIPAALHPLSPAPGDDIPASLHALSPAPRDDRLLPAPTHGSKRRPRKLTSIIWKEAEPIYIGGFLMQDRCNYCNDIFPASKVSGTSQLARHEVM